MRRDENGIVMVVLVVALLPLLLIAGTFTVAMTSRTSQFQTELARERALLAAESGIDYAIYRGRIGMLLDGDEYIRDLGNGMSFNAKATYLKTDTNDNDSDTIVDEADEDVFQVVVTGSFQGASRRLAAYLGPVQLLPNMDTAIGVQNPNVTITLQGTSEISGWDTNVDDTAGTDHKPALSVAAPGTVADLLGELTGSEPNKVVGPGGPPSLGVIPASDIATLVAQLQNVANLVLTSNQYSAYSFGDGPNGVTNITYRNGDVKFTGNTQGAGILVVTGNLTMTGNFRFDGVIIVLGDIDNSAGTADVYGSILQGPAGGDVTFKGTSKVRYSSEAIALANSGSGSYVSFNGWQELSK